MREAKAAHPWGGEEPPGLQRSWGSVRRREWYGAGRLTAVGIAKCQNIVHHGDMMIH